MFLYLLMILSFFINNIICNKISYEILEETQQNEEIGNILSRIPLNLRRDKLSFVCDSKFFSVSPDGKLVVKKIIDLESLCLTDKLCCGGEFCLLKVGILIKSQEKDIIENLVLDIKVIDRNDHKPKFESETQSVLLSEYSNVGSKVSLKPAVDSDATMKNRIQSYQLIEKTNTFSLDLSKTPSVSLSVVQKLDYEVKKEYEAILKACDQDFCAEQKLIINIKDENDNSPIFSQQTYTYKIKENLNIGDSIGKVEAVDRDSGRLGEVRYSISSESDADLRATFLVHTTSGKIFLRSILSTSTRENYNFRILARDSDPVNPRQAVCNVIVTVIDVNDHRPDITLLRGDDDVGSGGTNGGSGVTGTASGGVKIPENDGVRYVTTLKVVDLDKGNNARVLCWLDPQSDQLFELIKNTENVYSLKSRSSFDHEKIKKIDVNMICKDYGNPSLESKKQIPIYITDLNEYYPSFVYPRNSSSSPTNGYYTASIMENSEKGSQLIRVKAVDRDGSAILKYTLDKTGSEYFDINEYSGVITCGNKMLDREKEPHLKFTVFVTDSEIDPKRESAVVKVTVLDANDHSPVFDDNLPQFSLIENTPRLKLPDRIIATDQDLGDNGAVEYELKSAWNAHTMQRCDGYFFVTRLGYVETLLSLDREKCSLYILEIVAKDLAHPPEIPRESSVNVTLRVLDENDNAPVWRYPDKPIYNITDAMRPGNHLIQVQAIDLDEGLNKDVKYKIKQQFILQSSDLNQKPRTGHTVHYFSLNSTTGQLWVAQVIQPGTIILTLQAYDLGQPSKSTDIELIIHVASDPDSDYNRRQTAQLNMTIIAVMITVTVLVFLFLVIAISCVWRRPMHPPKYLVTKQHEVMNPGSPQLDPAMIPVGNEPPWLDSTLTPVLLDDDTASVYPAPNNYNSYESNLSISQPPTSYHPGTLITSGGSGGGGSKSPYFSHITRSPLLVDNNGTPIQLHPYNTGPILGTHEPIDGDSGDSGKGPSEEGLNYFTLRQPLNFPATPNIRSNSSNTNNHSSTFRSPTSTNTSSYNENNHSGISISPSRSNNCHYFILPEDMTTNYNHLQHHHQQHPYHHHTPVNHGGYNTMSLPRYHANINGNKRLLSNYHHPLIDNSIIGTTTTTTTTPTTTSASPKLIPHHLKLTPMHIRKINQSDNIPVTTSIISTTTGSESIQTNSSTKTVVHNNNEDNNNNNNNNNED